MRLVQIDSDFFLDNDRETVTKRFEKTVLGANAVEMEIINMFIQVFAINFFK